MPKKDFENKTYRSVTEAVKAWAGEYRAMSEEYEYAVFVYKKRKGDGSFYLGRTARGMKDQRRFRANVIFAFIYFYFIESVKEFVLYLSSIAAFIHTHPRPAAGYTNRNFSKEDLFTLKFRRIRTIYLVPFENGEVYKKT